MPFVKTSKELGLFGTQVLKLSRIALGATRTRARYRSRFKNKQMVSSTKKQYKGKINASGALSKSLEYKVRATSNSLRIAFYMNDYGIYIDQGRRAGKVPTRIISDWIETKRLRPRQMIKRQDGSTMMGGFAPNTTANKKAMAFMIARKIKFHGYEKTEFFTESFDKTFNKLERGLTRAVANDIELNLL